MTSRIVDIAVVGTGWMGSNHARVLDGLKNARLVAVVDTSIERARKIAAQYGCEAYDSIEALPGRVEAATVAVPASAHRDVGCYLLDNGIHVMMEKPMAPSEEECLALIASANAADRILMVGHIERFNPAVPVLLNLLPQEGKILAAEARRLSFVPNRANDVDVIMDLMIHDLDIILKIFPQPVVASSTLGLRSRPDGAVDHVSASLGFGSGSTALITSSKVTHHKIRQLHVTTENGLFELDFPRQELVVFRQGVEVDVKGTKHTALDVVSERIFLRNAEPLAAELVHFVTSVINRTPVAVTAEDALRCLRVAWDLRRQMNAREVSGAAIL